MESYSPLKIGLSLPLKGYLATVENILYSASFAGLQNKYEILDLGDGATQVTISTNFENGQDKAAERIEEIFQIAADGLKKYMKRR